MLVDTSVWIDHLRSGNRRLSGLLEDAEVETHPFVIGELACGNMRDRGRLLELLERLPTVRTATKREVLHFVETRELSGSGLGWVDMHLLCGAILSGTTLWSLDRKLMAHAEALGVRA